MTTESQPRARRSSRQEEGTVPRRPSRLAEGLLLGALVFGPLAFGAVETWSVTIFEILIFCAAAAAFVPFLGGSYVPMPKPAKPFALAFGLIIVIGLLQSLHPNQNLGPAALFFTTSRSATLSAILLWTCYAALFAVAVRIFESEGAHRRFALTIFILGAVVAAIGLMQRGQGNEAYYGLRAIRQGRPFGPYTNYDHAASMMVLSFFMGLGFFLSRFQTQIRFLPDFVSVQLLLLFGLGLIVAGIAETASRGAIHSALIASWASALVLAGAVRDKSQRLLICGALAAAVVIYVLVLRSHLEWIGYINGQLYPYRVSIDRSCLKIIKDFPLFGTGLGAFQAVFRFYQEPSVVGFVDHAHSDWLELLVQAGPLALIAFSCVLACLLARLGRGLSLPFPAENNRVPSLLGWEGCLPTGQAEGEGKKIRASTRIWATAVFAAILAFCLHGLVEFSFQIPANAGLFLATAAFGTSWTSPGNSARKGPGRSKDR